MAPVTTTTQALPAKIKRPVPPGIQTNGINSSTSSPSPSLSSAKLPNSAKNPPHSATSNGVGASGPRSANRLRRDGSTQAFGRGQRSAVGSARLGGINADMEEAIPADPTPYGMQSGHIGVMVVLISRSDHR